jgi:type I restriction enzyme S subunit
MPPLPEQQRIVARIGALLSHVNEARGRLQRVPGIMKKFRQGVLAAACEGRLMGTPDGYESRPAGDFFIDARYGTSNKCDYTKEKKIPVLRIPNIATEKLELTDLKYGVLSDKEIQKLAVQEGDLIICRTNGSLDLVGKAAIIPKLSNQFVFASYLIRVRLNRDLLLPEYYHICLTSQVGRDHIEEMARSTAGQFNLNLEILRSMSVPLPPLAEQHEIVRRVNALFARADAIELEVADATKRADALTQAVLGKAFAGKL